MRKKRMHRMLRELREMEAGKEIQRFNFPELEEDNELKELVGVER